MFIQLTEQVWVPIHRIARVHIFDEKERRAITSPTGFGINSIANNGTFTVSNNQYVTFGVETGCNQNPVVTVKNQSDSDAILDTFAMVHLGEC